MTALRHLGRPADPRDAEWLLKCCLPEGGFLGGPMAPVPDLLSTATALFAFGRAGPAPPWAIRDLASATSCSRPAGAGRAAFERPRRRPRNALERPRGLD